MKDRIIRLTAEGLRMLRLRAAYDGPAPTIPAEGAVEDDEHLIADDSRLYEVVDAAELFSDQPVTDNPAAAPAPADVQRAKVGDDVQADNDRPHPAEQRPPFAPPRISSAWCPYKPVKPRRNWVVKLIELQNEYPEAALVCEHVRRELRRFRETGSTYFRPIMLIGPVESRKNEFAGALAEAVTRYVSIPSFKSSDQPKMSDHESRQPFAGSQVVYSVPAKAIIEHRVANPILIINDLCEKHQDSFLALRTTIDPQTASTFFDHCIGNPVDCSMINFIITSDDTTSLPPGLMDLCTPLYFPIHDRPAAPQAADVVVDEPAPTLPPWLRPITDAEAQPAPPAVPVDAEVTHKLPFFDPPLLDEPDEPEIPAVMVIPPEAAGGYQKRSDEPPPNWLHFAGRRVELRFMPDGWHRPLRRLLRSKYPHAGAIIDAVLGDMLDKSGYSHLKFAPTILVGPPGCGKTTFCTDIAMVLANASYVPLISCAGNGDKSFGGTNKRWSNGDVCVPLSIIIQTQIANPIIVMDEVEKAAEDRRNGYLLDVLLGMLEPMTSKRYFDPSVEAPVDLSHVNWLMTANSVSGLSQPLLDRCRVIRFPMPGVEHLEALAASVLDEQRAEKKLRAEWQPPLAPYELEALAEVWPGGSIRALRRLLAGVIEAREEPRRAMPN